MTFILTFLYLTTSHHVTGCHLDSDFLQSVINNYVRSGTILKKMCQHKFYSQLQSLIWCYTTVLISMKPWQHYNGQIPALLFSQKNSSCYELKKPRSKSSHKHPRNTPFSLACKYTQLRLQRDSFPSLEMLTIRSMPRRPSQKNGGVTVITVLQDCCTGKQHWTEQVLVITQYSGLVYCEISGSIAPRPFHGFYLFTKHQQSKICDPWPACSVQSITMLDTETLSSEQKRGK